MRYSELKQKTKEELISMIKDIDSEFRKSQMDYKYFRSRIKDLQKDLQELKNDIELKDASDKIIKQRWQSK